MALHKHPERPDYYEATITPDVEGPWTFEVQAWSDPIGTWEHAAGLKIPAGVDVELMFTEARLLFERVRERARPTPSTSRSSRPPSTRPRTPSARPRPAWPRSSRSELTSLLAEHPIRELVTIEGPYPMYADRQRALFGSWYEFFPRSEGATIDPETGHAVSGNFRTALARLDYAADLGFDIVYLPPIHPIGEVNRKGPNNTLTPEPHDTGSPWAIGSKDGGHDAIHPDLGTFEDFDAFVAHAKSLGLEIALDLALQCAPDHPWVADAPGVVHHPRRRHDRLRREPAQEVPGHLPGQLRQRPHRASVARCCGIVKLWMSHGVRVFRVDNPHTKPVAFWEWLLREVRRTDPDVLFLAEAFTRPAMMSTLGAIGYHQSYTYFTWRTAKWEIEDYLRELSHRTDHVMRPNFFVNTPDILHESLQYGGPAMFKIRAVLAACGSPSWGVYSGYELYEHVAVKPGSEEYLDSEKYQIRRARLGRCRGRGADPRAVHPGLNRVRREHPALQLLRNVTIHSADDENVLVFSKRAGRRHRPRGHQPRPARRPRDHRAPQHARSRDGVARQLRRLRRDHDADLELEGAQLRAARPRARTCPHPEREEGMTPPGDDGGAEGRPAKRSTRSCSETVRGDFSEADPADTPARVDVPEEVHEVEATTESQGTPEWFKTAVFYEVLVRSFRDAERRRHRRLPWPRPRSSTTCSGWASTACGCRRS